MPVGISQDLLYLAIRSSLLELYLIWGMGRGPPLPRGLTLILLPHKPSGASKECVWEVGDGCTLPSQSSQRLGSSSLNSSLSLWKLQILKVSRPTQGHRLLSWPWPRVKLGAERALSPFWLPPDPWFTIFLESSIPNQSALVSTQSWDQSGLPDVSVACLAPNQCHVSLKWRLPVIVYWFLGHEEPSAP